ncbi:hypothetical protein [Massilia sp. CF038]|uniref:hypothetical protein n=1 Tax=Massilia sp. CF038 TaxID=1881045 RepID=UPI001160F96A|nr:hypothetical protein [Massilia sp. CF038]
MHPTAHQTVPPTVPPAALRQPTVAHQLAQALARLAHDDGPAPQYVPGPHDPDRRREGQGRRSDDLADTCSYD